MNWKFGMAIGLLLAASLTACGSKPATETAPSPTPDAMESSGGAMSSPSTSPTGGAMEAPGGAMSSPSTSPSGGAMEAPGGAMSSPSPSTSP